MPAPADFPTFFDDSFADVFADAVAVHGEPVDAAEACVWAYAAAIGRWPVLRRTSGLQAYVQRKAHRPARGGRVELIEQPHDQAYKPTVYVAAVELATERRRRGFAVLFASAAVVAAIFGFQATQGSDKEQISVRDEPPAPATAPPASKAIAPSSTRRPILLDIDPENATTVAPPTASSPAPTASTRPPQSATPPSTRRLPTPVTVAPTTTTSPPTTRPPTTAPPTTVPRIAVPPTTAPPTTEPPTTAPPTVPPTAAPPTTAPPTTKPPTTAPPTTTPPPTTRPPSPPTTVKLKGPCAKKPDSNGCKQRSLQPD